MQQEQINTEWLLTCTALVIFMQGGFCLLESGLVRSKNSINVAAKNLFGFCLACLIFWGVGAGIMLGASYGGLIGTNGFFSDGGSSSEALAFLTFQMMFCGTAATIISGAVAERMRLGGYLLIVLILSIVIYPIFGHWAWAGAGDQAGWLKKLGFIDFAGSTVVHSVGGWVALAAVLVIGPRIGRFSSEKTSINGHNIPMATIGLLVLWLGWFGFNGGSAQSLSSNVPFIIFNTMMAGSAGGITGLGLSWLIYKRVNVSAIINAVIAGLVGITAGCHAVNPAAALAIGAIAALLCFLTAIALEKLKIDDVIGVFPAHGVGGIWGALAVAIFGDPMLWETGLDRWDQLLVQATGVLTCFVWAFGVGFALLWTINRVWSLRVSPEEEKVGLNVSEHGASTEILDLLTQLEKQRLTGDFTRQVEEEPHTEIGQIATQYNRVLNTVTEEIAKNERLQAEKHKREKSLIHDHNELLQAALHETQTQKLALDQHAIVSITNIKGVLTHVNDKFCDISGYSREELMGRTHRIIMSNHHPPEFYRKMWKTIASGQVWHGIFKNKAKDDTHYWVDSTIIPFKDEHGEITQYIGIRNDITPLMEAKEELSQMNLKTKSLLHSISAILIEMDREGIVNSWNEAAESVLEIPTHLAIGKRLLDLPIEWNANLIDQKIQQCLDEGTPQALPNTPFLDQSNREKIIKISFDPIMDESHVSQGILMVADDITQHQQLLHQLNEAQRLEIVGQLAAGIAHEINTPTQFIGDNTQFLQTSFENLKEVFSQCNALAASLEQGIVPNELVERLSAAMKESDLEYLEEEIPKAIEQSLDGISRVSTIVKSMKELSHPGREEMQAVDLHHLIENTITISRNEWKYAAELVTDFDPSLPHVHCLAGPINQVILNMIINASHAISSAQKKPREIGIITIATRLIEDQTEIRVTDTGCGIPESIKDKVFTPFFTTKEVGKGTGQGLAIAYSIIVDKHGGSITIESEEGAGTTFIICLPVEPAKKLVSVERESK
jgi:ammonium transporter